MQQRLVVKASSSASISKARSKAINHSITMLKPVISTDPAFVNFDKRMDLLDELLNTERSYIVSMEYIITYYLQPCKQEQLLTNDERESIFSNLEIICEIHKRLENRLNEVISVIKFAEKLEFHISTIFCEMIPDFKHYMAYVSMFQSSRQTLESAKKRNIAFKQLLEKGAREDPGKHILEDYLIQPVQRLCKYPLLFKNLIACTSNEHPDYQQMCDTLIEVEKLTNQVNEMNKKAENYHNLMIIRNRIQSIPFNLNDNEREHLKDSKLNVYLSMDKLFKQRRVYLFNDILLICHLNVNQSEDYLIHFSFDKLILIISPLAFIEMKSTLDMKIGEYSIQLNSIGNDCVYCNLNFEKQKDYLQWLNLIRINFDKQKNMIEFYRKFDDLSTASLLSSPISLRSSTSNQDQDEIERLKKELEKERLKVKKYQESNQQSQTEWRKVSTPSPDTLERSNNEDRRKRIELETLLREERLQRWSLEKKLEELSSSSSSSSSSDLSTFDEMNQRKIQSVPPIPPKPRRFSRASSQFPTSLSISDDQDQK